MYVRAGLLSLASSPPSRQAGGRRMCEQMSFLHSPFSAIHHDHVHVENVDVQHSAYILDLGLGLSLSRGSPSPSDRSSSVSCLTQ